MTTTLKKHALVVIDGQVCQLLSPPRKTVAGTWYLVFRTVVGGKPQSTYATTEELNKITKGDNQ